MGRTPCCDKIGLKKGPWTPQEDLKLTNYIQIHGPGNWRNLPKNAGLQRCGKSCRLRWTNYLRPDIRRGRFSFEEEETIIQLHGLLGNKWSAIAGRLPGRTDNEIKNYWNTHIRKRLLRNGIDPVTHAPRLDLSSILNVSNLQALLHPQLLSLVNTLLSLKQQNPDILQHQNQLSNSQQAPNQDASACTTSTVPCTGLLQATDMTNFSSYPNSDLNLTSCTLTNAFVEQPNCLSHFQSVDGSQNYSFDSVRSTPISSPTPLHSSSTFMNSCGHTTDDERESFSSLLKFEIPESLDISDYL